jgi:hypothetical protein
MGMSAAVMPVPVPVPVPVIAEAARFLGWVHFTCLCNGHAGL